MNKSAVCRVAVAILGILAFVCSAVRGTAGENFKDPKGKTLVVAVDDSVGEAVTGELGAALQRHLSAARPDLEARVFSTNSAESTAETLLGMPAANRKEIGVLVEIRSVAVGSDQSNAVAEVYHYPFGSIAREHVRSPEYSFKFGSDSALFAIELHRLSTGHLDPPLDRGNTAIAVSAPLFPRMEIVPATGANPLLPVDLLRRSVSLTVDAPENSLAGNVDPLATLLANAFLAFLDEEGSFVMGVLPDKARKRGAPESLSISISPYIYKNGEEAEQDTKALTVLPFPSGLYYADRLTSLTPYSYTITDPAASELRQDVAEGGFITSSMGGVVRTVPVKLDSYTPLESRASSLPDEIPVPETLDVVIEGATVFDGTKDRPRFVADVGVAGDRIIAVGDLKDSARKETISGDGLFLMPGFVDIHSHADWDINRVPYAPSHVRQGITTVLGGNCASSPLAMGVFLGELEQSGAAVNLAILAGNRPIRERVLGRGKGMFPYDELYREKELVDLAMEEGAVGMSTGLIYRTSEEAFAWELAEMAKQMKPYGGFYASHVRGETDEVLDAIREAIHIGELAEVPVEISHMKVLSKRNWGQMTEYLEIMKAARARGLDVTGDQYPWRASGPAAHYGLYRLMVREAIQNETPEVVLLKDMPGKYARYSGRPLTELLDGENMTPEDLIADLNLTRESKIYATYLCIGADDVLLPMKEDFVMVCTDAGMVSLKDIEDGKVWDEHPRKFRTYPEFFAHYVRDKQVCSWELGVYKCTGLPAWRLKLEDRGVIKPGAYADLVLLDPERLDPGSDYRDQVPPPKGIQYVFINGQAVVKDGQMTMARAGRPLYGYRHRKP